MRLSELFELSPLGWEEAKRLTILEYGELYWGFMVDDNYDISYCFDFLNSSNPEMWRWLQLGKTTLLKEWEAKQIKTVKQ